MIQNHCKSWKKHDAANRNFHNVDKNYFLVFENRFKSWLQPISIVKHCDKCPKLP